MMLDLISGGALIACVVGISFGVLYLREHAKLVDACKAVRDWKSAAYAALEVAKDNKRIASHWRGEASALEAEKRLAANKRKSAAYRARHAQMEQRKALVTQKTAELRKEIAA